MQRKNNLNLVNFTHRKILFSIFFKPFIHFPGNKYLLEKGKTKKLIHFSTVHSAQLAKWPAVPCSSPRPGRNLGLGQDFGLAPSPA